MGKTLTNILLVAAAVAVNVVPGVGQVVSGVIGTALTGAVMTATTIAGIGALQSLLGPGLPKPDTTETPLKTSRPPRVSAYGRSRLYGAYAIFETASDGTAVDVYAVHDGKIDGIERYYLGDERVSLTGDTVATGTDGRYRDGAVHFYTTDGSAPGAGFPALEALLPGVWTAGHRGDGVAAIALTAKSVKAKVYQETYPSSGVPLPSIVARWQKCPDPAAADPLDESGWTWTENPVRQLLHYELVRKGPRPALPKSNAGYAAALDDMRQAWWARKIAPTLAYWVAAAADCDAPRALKAGGADARYRSNVAHKHTDAHKDVVASILATFDGWVAPRGDGALVVYSGKSYAPTVSIGSDEIVSYNWDGAGVDDDGAVNEVICSYVSSEHDFNTVECDAWRDETDIVKRGAALSESPNFAVPSHAQARYLAKRFMARKSARRRGSVTTNLAGRIARGHRFINLRLEEAGAVFFDGIAEIQSLTRNLRGGVSFTWVEHDPNVDAWNPATEEGEPAAIGNRVAQAALTPPAIATATPVYAADGVRVELDVTAPDRSDLTWVVHWRVAGAVVWGPDEQFSDSDPGASVLLITGAVPADASIELQVAYRVGDGRYSPFSDVETVSTSTAAIPPAAPTDLAASGAAGTASVTWRNPASANFSYARVYRGTTSTFASAAPQGGDISGGAGAAMLATANLAAGTYYFWVRSFNAAGVGSTTTPGPVTATVT